MSYHRRQNSDASFADRQSKTQRLAAVSSIRLGIRFIFLDIINHLQLFWWRDERLLQSAILPEAQNEKDKLVSGEVLPRSDKLCARTSLLECAHNGRRNVRHGDYLFVLWAQNTNRRAPGDEEKRNEHK